MNAPKSFLSRHLLLIIQTALVCLFFGVFIARYYPLIGADYRYFIPRLIDSQLHYHINGLSIQWYTPSFGGGLPSYPNPQQIQFSLPQFLTGFFDPFRASLASILIFICLGMIGFYRLGKYSLEMGTISALAGALFFTFNGFMLQHMGIGHLTFMGFMLLPFVLSGLLSRYNTLINGILLGWVISILLYGGGFYTIVYFVFSTFISLPLILFFQPGKFTLHTIAKNGFAGAVIAICLSASKLSAVLAFLRNFPRNIEDVYNNTLTQGLLSIPLQLAGTMTLSPIGILSGMSHKYAWDLLMTYTGSNLSLWELDISLSPILFMILALGVFLGVKATIQNRATYIRDHWASLAWLLIALEITVEFIIARGPLYSTISQLPILDSLHVNPRYTSAMIMPISLLAGFILNSFFINAKLPEKNQMFAWFLITFGTLAFGLTYFALPIDNLQRRQFDVSGSTVVWQQVQSGDTFPVDNIQTELRDQRVFDQHASTLTPYEVLFGYGMRSFRPTLIPGSIYDIRNESYNMNDPSGFVFGEINGSKPFDQIPTKDLAKLTDLINRRQPAYLLPWWQIVANWISLFAMVTTLAATIFITLRSRHNNRATRNLEV